MEELIDKNIVNESGVENILNKLSIDEDDDIHPEKRMRSVYISFLIQTI